MLAILEAGEHSSHQMLGSDAERGNHARSLSRTLRRRAKCRLLLGTLRGSILHRVARRDNQVLPVVVNGQPAGDVFSGQQGGPADPIGRIHAVRHQELERPGLLVPRAEADPDLTEDSPGMCIQVHCVRDDPIAPHPSLTTLVHASHLARHSILESVPEACLVHGASMHEGLDAEPRAPIGAIAGSCGELGGLTVLLPDELAQLLERTSDLHSILDLHRDERDHDDGIGLSASHIERQ